ncbi:Uncharacterized protein APZ42_013710 [Daphnia magna]|uniref:Uncharacterized protein n=1 Tax=Daphnia magna TaxID=35525 RepID=A0A162QRG1_9CRUS|nr:Uncharacterized protein APZ42_013710 [Daphnia magna]
MTSRKNSVTWKPNAQHVRLIGHLKTIDRASDELNVYKYIQPLGSVRETPTRHFSLSLSLSLSCFGIVTAEHPFLLSFSHCHFSSAD